MDERTRILLLLHDHLQGVKVDDGRTGAWAAVDVRIDDDSIVLESARRDRLQIRLTPGAGEEQDHGQQADSGKALDALLSERGTAANNGTYWISRTLDGDYQVRGPMVEQSFGSWRKLTEWADDRHTDVTSGWSKTEQPSPDFSHE
jgi:hypothetical protein